MTAHRLEVADVVRKHGQKFLEAYGASISAHQKRVLRAIESCRTERLGGHVWMCDACGVLKVSYNSCRDRHCPKCQAAARARWMEERAAELLPVPYFHVVFTLPHQLGPLALQNKRVVYDILFQAASQTLLEIAADPKHLGAQIGFLAILHTWSQKLMHHPHLHCVVPGGGISMDGNAWVPCKRSKKSQKDYFLPVKVLSLVFQGKFIDFLKKAYRKGELKFHGELRELAKHDAFERRLDQAVQKKWVVYAKRPFGGPQQVLKYLARYTHRVAISNSRLLNMEAGKVEFRYKDYADAGSEKSMSLDGPEFLRRFLMHVLPSGFMKIRHYGFLWNRYRKEKLELCRQLLDVDNSHVNAADQSESELTATPTRICCPVCGDGEMLILERLEPIKPNHVPVCRPHFLSLPNIANWDTS